MVTSYLHVTKPTTNMFVARYPDAFTSLDERVHASRRKIVNNLYSMSNIVRAEEGIDSCNDMFMARMTEFSNTGEIIDMSKWAQM